MIQPYEAYVWDMEQIGQLIGTGMQMAIITIFTCFLVGFTINKIIKLMIGRF